jgi:ParB family chromosome partitioning protein
LQLIANLQRENITALEETAGIRTLVEKFGYTQTKAAKILNKSRSYISQTLGLERLAPHAKEIVQTSELSKEVLIQASRQTDPEMQVKILKKASSEGQTVRQIREEGKNTDYKKKKQISTSNNRKFQKWQWKPKDKRFELTIRFSRKHEENKKISLVRNSLKEALTNLLK